jgi:hypothetical protein
MIKDQRWSSDQAERKPGPRTKCSDITDQSQLKEKAHQKVNLNAPKIFQFVQTILPGQREHNTYSHAGFIDFLSTPQPKTAVLSSCHKGWELAIRCVGGRVPRCDCQRLLKLWKRWYAKGEGLVHLRVGSRYEIHLSIVSCFSLPSPRSQRSSADTPPQGGLEQPPPSLISRAR